MNAEPYRSSRLRSMAAAALTLYIVAFSASACELTTVVRDATVDDIRSFFRSENKLVLTFVGYSGAGYEDNTAMLTAAAQVLEEFDSSKSIVNIGATPEGIGAVYELAKRRGFMTTGIVSTLARAYGAEFSPCVDHVFFVQDATWGGFLAGSERLSPTSTAMVENSDVVVGIGGGEVGRDELMASKRLGIDVRFIPADMNHRIARDKARKKGLPAPTNFSGAAGEVF